MIVESFNKAYKKNQNWI